MDRKGKGLVIRAAAFVLMLALLSLAAPRAGQIPDQGTASVSGWEVAPPVRQGGTSQNGTSQNGTSQNGTPPNGTPPTFLDYNATPLSGDTSTLFTFSVWVVDADGAGITEVYVIIDGGRFGMMQDASAGGPGSNRSRYIKEMKLGKGDRSIHFNATDASGESADTSSEPIEISVKEKRKEALSDRDRYVCLGILIVFTLIVMTWTVRQFLKRKKMQELAFSTGDADERGVTCTACRKPVDPDDRECPHCGEEFEGVEEVCPFCDTKVPRGAGRCPLCKKKFKGGFKEISKRSKGRFSCPDCGAVVDPGQKVCPGCDAELGGASALKTKKGSSAEKKDDVFMCSMCGSDVRESEAKCSKCGADFS